MRLRSADPPRSNVSRTPVDVLRIASAADSSVVRSAAVATDDFERAAAGLRPDVLEDLDELEVGPDEVTRPVVTELAPAEVRAQVSH